MNEYTKQAKDFLESCNATMKIIYLGKDTNKTWNDKTLRNTYRAIIKTPKGNMSIKFWDSIANTEGGELPDEYDVLSCLQKYDVGSFENFVWEYGYETEDFEDRCRAKRIYKSVCKEYEKVCSCFTEEQIEAMKEIQ